MRCSSRTTAHRDSQTHQPSTRATVGTLKVVTAAMGRVHKLKITKHNFELSYRFVKFPTVGDTSCAFQHSATRGILCRASERLAPSSNSIEAPMMFTF